MFIFLFDTLQQVDGVCSEISRCQASLEQCKDEMQILCEIEIATSSSADSAADNTQSLLDTVNAKYHNMMRYDTYILPFFFVSFVG